MKKLLLQSAIVALVSTGSFSHVMADISAAGQASLIFQRGGIKTVTGVLASALNLSFTVRSDLDPISFDQKYRTAPTLNDLYDLSSADTTQGCIQLAHIDNTVDGGRVDSIMGKFHIFFNEYTATSSTIPKDSILFLTDNGICGTPSSNTFMGLSDALATAKIGSAFARNHAGDKPLSIDGKIALYYRIPADSLRILRVANPDIALNKFYYNKTTTLHGQLDLKITPGP